MCSKNYYIRNITNESKRKRRSLAFIVFVEWNYILVFDIYRQGKSHQTFLFTNKRKMFPVHLIWSITLAVALLYAQLVVRSIRFLNMPNKIKAI